MKLYHYNRTNPKTSKILQKILLLDLISMNVSVCVSGENQRLRSKLNNLETCRGTIIKFSLIFSHVFRFSLPHRSCTFQSELVRPAVFIGQFLDCSIRFKLFNLFCVCVCVDLWHEEENYQEWRLSNFCVLLISLKRHGFFYQ